MTTEEAEFLATMLRQRVARLQFEREQRRHREERERLLDQWMWRDPGAAETAKRIARLLDQLPAAISFVFDGKPLEVCAHLGEVLAADEVYADTNPAVVCGLSHPTPPRLTCPPCGSWHVGGHRLSVCDGCGLPATDCFRLDANAVEARVWAEVTRLPCEPEALLSAAREFLGFRMAEIGIERDELAEVDRRIAERERTLLVDVADYLRRGVPADAVKAATDGIGRTGGAALPQRPAARLAVRLPSRVGPDAGYLVVGRTRGVPDKSDDPGRAGEGAAAAGRAVTVLDDGATPRLQVLGSVPRRMLLDRWF